MVRMVSACLVPWVSTTMAPSSGVLFALQEVTTTKRGQALASLVPLVLIKLNQVNPFCNHRNVCALSLFTIHIFIAKCYARFSTTLNCKTSYKKNNKIFVSFRIYLGIFYSTVCFTLSDKSLNLIQTCLIVFSFNYFLKLFLVWL